MSATGAPGRIGPYVLESEVGRGGMGVVYRARSAAGQVVALKTSRRMDDAEILGLRREIRSLARLDHPGIVRILDDGVQDGCPWYAMELVQGRRLEAVPEDAMAALTVVRRLCAPLAYLHGEGLVHRDLKPQNVVLKEDGYPVLLDFGLASVFAAPGGREELQVEGFSAGTAAFMSPEQLRGELVDARADLWSLGVMLYWLLTGRAPFATAGEACDPNAGAEPPSAVRRGMPAAFDGVVARLLCKDPRGRFGYADDVAAALGALGARNGNGGPRRRAYVYRAGFAGRAALLQALTAHVGGQVGTMGGGPVLIGGESGAGKTRLVIELSRCLEVMAVARVAGQGVPGGAALHPLLPLFQRVLGRCSPRPPCAVHSLAQEGGACTCEEDVVAARERILGGRERVLASLVPGLLRGSVVPEATERTEAARAEALDAVSTVVAALAREEKGLTVVIDDLQWADDLTLAWIERIAGQAATGPLAGAPVAILGTYRTEEVPDRLRAVTAAPGARVVRLDRLDAAAVAAMAGDMLASAAPPETLVEALVRGSEGNPLFAAEMLRASVDAGIVGRDEAGGWTVAGGSLPVPPSLRALMDVRLEGLDADAAAMCGALAVLGRESPVDLLYLVTGLEEARCHEGVARLLRCQILDVPAAGSLRFSHDKLREAALERLDAPTARRLHRRAAEARERLPEAERPWAALVGHWQEAGEPARARACALPAARRAGDGFDTAAAERFYRLFLAGEEPPPADRAARIDACEAREELGALLYGLGRTDASRALRIEAMALAEALGDAGLRARCHRSLATVTEDAADAERLYARALELAREDGEPTLVVSMLDALGLHLADVGERRRAEAIYEEAVELAARSGYRRGEARALGGLAQMWNDRGEALRTREAHLRLLDIYRAVGDGRQEGITLGNLGMSYQSEDVPRAAALLGEAVAKLRKVGDLRFANHLIGYLASARFELGEADEARRMLRDAVDDLGRCGDRRWQAMTLVVWTETEGKHGFLGEAARLSEEALGVSLEPSDIIVGFRAASAANLAVLRGDPPGRHLDDLEAIVARLELPPESQLGGIARDMRRRFPRA